MAEVKKYIGRFQKTLAIGKVEKHCGRFFYNPLMPIWKILLCPWQRLGKSLEGDIGYLQKTLAMGKVEKHCGRFFTTF